jgi:hypothetical protein
LQQSGRYPDPVGYLIQDVQATRAGKDFSIRLPLNAMYMVLQWVVVCPDHTGTVRESSRAVASLRKRMSVS